MSDLLHNLKIGAGILTRRVLTGPHSVQISFVDACNYRCVMCWEHSSELEGWGADDLARDYHANKRHKSTVMDIEMFRSLVDSLRNAGTREICLAGIGEPLLNKHVVEAVEHAKRSGMRMWITTNGSLLNEDLLTRFVDLGLDDLNVSINAGGADEYGQVHVNQEKTRFEEIVSHLEWLRDLKASRGKELPRVTLSNVVSNLNSHRAVDMMRTGVRASAVSVVYRPIDIFEGSSRFALQDEDFRRLAQAFPDVENIARENSMTTNVASFQELVDLRRGGTIPSPCFVAWLEPMVLANGDVTFCCISREVLGNLNESSFESIWFARRPELIRESLKIHRTQEPVRNSRCLGCEQSLLNLRLYRRLWPFWGRVSSKTDVVPVAPSAGQRRI